MAQPERIREQAKKSLEMYKADDSFARLKEAVGVTSKEKRARTECVRVRDGLGADDRRR